MNFKENRNAIIIGIISGLLVIYFIDPILSFFGNIVIKIAGHVYKSYLDNICSDLAVGEPDFSFAIYGLISGATLGAATSAGLIKLFTGYLTKVMQQNKPIKSISSWYIYVGIMLIVIMTLFLVVDGHIRFTSYVNFRQGITIVSPYISDIKHKEILSHFSLMKNTEDYNKIIDEIKSIAASNRINLPKNVTSKL